MRKNLVLGAAIAGLSAGFALKGCKSESSEPAKKDGNQQAATAGSEKHVCKGWNSCKGMGATAKNECKGHGDCATVKNECKSKNECKNLGGCDMGDNGCYGKNECKGKGGCKVPQPMRAKKAS